MKRERRHEVVRLSLDAAIVRELWAVAKARHGGDGATVTDPPGGILLE